MRPPESFVDALRGAHTCLLTGHEHPDGDCLGSQVALYHLLRELGKEVRILNPDPPARVWSFLAEHTPIEAWEPGAPLAPVDLAVLLDCSELQRLGRLRGPLMERATRIAIVDHHVLRGEADSTSWIDPDAPATGEMVHRLFGELHVPIGREAAEGLFVSLVADTGWFRYSNTSAHVLRLAGDLVALGVDASTIYDRIYRQNDPDSVAFLAECLQRCRITLGGRFGSVVIDRPQMERAARLGFDLDLVMEPLRSVAGMEVVAMIKCSYDGGVRVSLRSSGDVDVQVIAARLGGGGHRKAAGAAVFGDPEDVLKTIQAAVADAVESIRRGGIR